MRSSRSVHRGRHHFRRLLLEPLEARCLLSFLPAVNYDSGFDTWTVTAADLTGNGIPDLVIPDGTGTVKVLLGTGDGSFLPAQSYAAGSYPFHVAVGDFNGDGIPDLAVAGFGAGGGVSVLLGNGDGSFQAPQTYATGTGSITVVAADLDGDGALDLAVANEDSHNVSVLLGNGNGSFQPALNYAAGAYVNWMAVGDFNGDGVPDLVSAGYSDGTVNVLLGNGDGSFQAPVSYRAAPAGGYAYSVAVGDFDGDGIADLAVPTPFSTGSVSILLGNGDGSFQAPISYSLDGVNPSFAAVADYNGDGIPDLALTNPNNPPDQGVSVLLGNGDGSFQAPTTYAVGLNPEVLVAGDINGDGFADLAVPNVLDSTVSVLINDANWGSRSPQLQSRHEQLHGGILAVQPTASLPQSTLEGNPVAIGMPSRASETGQSPWNNLTGQVFPAEIASLVLPDSRDPHSMEDPFVGTPRGADAGERPDRLVAAPLNGVAQNLALALLNPFEQA